MNARMGRWIRASLAGVMVQAIATSPARSQDRITVLAEAGTPVVATEVLVAAGPGDEPEGKAGLAYLAARAVTAPALPVLDSLGARLSVTPLKDAMSFTLIAAPDAWEDATRVLLVSLFRDPPRAETVAAERDSVRAELVSRQSNPADAAAREADAALYGRDHAWGRPTVGTPESVAGLTVADVDDFLRTSFTSDRVVVAVVGPVDQGEVRDHLRPYINVAGALAAEIEPLQPERSPVRRNYNSITTWTSVSYRFPTSIDLEALRFLAQLALDELEFSPVRRSVFNARAEIHHRLTGGELRFQVVTPPEEAEDWARTILDVVDDVAHQPMLDERFEARLRRYRGERLQALAAPEERARELARELLVRGDAGALVAGLDGMTVERLQAAVSRLSAPIVLLLGPFQEESG